MTTATKAPLGISELVRRVGDDNIHVEPIEPNLQGAKLVERGRLTEIRIVTRMTTPNEVAAPGPLPNVGMLIWFRRDHFDRARLEHDEAAAAPSDADKLATATKRTAKLEDLLTTLLQHGVERVGMTVRCRHCHRYAAPGDPIEHRGDCIVAKTLRGINA